MSEWQVACSTLSECVVIIRPCQKDGYKTAIPPERRAKMLWKTNNCCIQFSSEEDMAAPIVS